MAEGRLKEVEEDAMRITARRFREQEEERQYQIAKTEAEKTKVTTEVDSPSEKKGTNK